MGGLRKVYLKGTTLIESLVAMLILLITISCCAYLFLQVRVNGMSMEKLKGEFIANQIYCQSIQSNDFKNDEFKLEDFRVTKEVTPFQSEKKLVIQKIEVFSSSNNSLYKRSDVLSINQK